jgi:hypothetical protein
MFREFWDKSAHEIEDLGAFIRESIDEWLRHRKETYREKEPGETDKTKSV